MIFRQIFAAETSSYTYLLAGGARGEALLIDPVLARVEQYLRLLRELRLKLVAALDTHLHADHLSGVGALRERTACRGALRGEELAVAGLRLRVIQTPGHSEDARCLRLPDRVFTGDTLLIRGTGRTDLPGGDARAQWRSLRKLLALPDVRLSAASGLAYVVGTLRISHGIYGGLHSFSDARSITKRYLTSPSSIRS